MMTEVNIIVEGGMVTDVFATAGHHVLVSVIDLDSDIPEDAYDAEQTANKIRRDPALESVW